MTFAEKVKRDLEKEMYSELTCSERELDEIGIDFTAFDDYRPENDVQVVISWEEIYEYYDIIINDGEEEIYTEECYKEDDSATSAWFFNK